MEEGGLWDWIIGEFAWGLGDGYEAERRHAWGFGRAAAFRFLHDRSEVVRGSSGRKMEGINMMGDGGNYHTVSMKWHKPSGKERQTEAKVLINK